MYANFVGIWKSFVSRITVHALFQERLWRNADDYVEILCAFPIQYYYILYKVTFYITKKNIHTNKFFMFNKNIGMYETAFNHQCSFDYFCFIANKKSDVEPPFFQAVYIYRTLSPRNNVFLSFFLSDIFSMYNYTVRQVHVHESKACNMRTEHAARQ